jgi:hypothetical protein
MMLPTIRITFGSVQSKFLMDTVIQLYSGEHISRSTSRARCSISSASSYNRREISKSPISDASRRHLITWSCIPMSVSRVSAMYCLFPRLQFAGQPAYLVRFHRIGRDRQSDNVNAFRALEIAKIEPGRPRHDPRQHHAVLAISDSADAQL